MNKYLLPLLALSLMTMLISCNGIFDDIYDDAGDDEGGSTEKTDGVWHITNLDVTDYSAWIYLDIHNSKITDTITMPLTLTGTWDGRSGITYNHVVGTSVTKLSDVQTDAHQDADVWDIAIHHFDIKTNGGSAIETSYTSLDDLPASSAAFASQTFTEDVWTTHQVIYDLSGMLNYDVGYQNSYCNLVLSNWVTMDFSTPPPVYSVSGKVYVIRLKDGTYAALKLENYMKKSGKKGYMTFDIKYPY